MRNVVLLGVALALTGGCAWFEKVFHKAQTPAPEEEFVEGEETGVDAIADLLRQFRRQLTEKQFDDATRLILRAENAIKKPSDLTRAHPDFDDLAETVRTSRTKLEAAIEADRIARREAAIDDIIRRGNAAVREAVALFNQLKVRVPAADDVETLAGLVTTLSTLHADGQKFAEEARYKTHADDRDKRTAALEERLGQARWQIKASETISKHIEDAYQAATKVKNAESSSDRIKAFQKASTGFSGCVDTINELETDPEYRGDWLIESRLGAQTIAKTKRMCTERSTRARREGYRLDWHNGVLEAVESLAEPLAKIRSAKKAAEALSVAEEAIAVLANCQAMVNKMGRHPGVDVKKTFDTALGKLTLSRLKQACSNEQTRLGKMLPTLRWRKSLDAVGKRIDETKFKMDQAHLAKDVGMRVDTWKAAIDSLKECVNSARKVSHEPGADHAFIVKTALGKLTVQGMEKECSRQLPIARVQLGEATRALELNEFVGTCRGDEVAVARRDGIPSRVENVEGGRIFVYEKRGKKLVVKRYGFDATGKRVDFRLRWLNQVGSLVSEVNRAMQAIARASTGAEALEATEAALPVLGKCIEAAAGDAKKPGYDGSAVFTTTLGSVAASKLGKLCDTERARRTKSIVGLKWRIELEELRDRVREAQTEMSKTKGSGNSTENVEKISSAIAEYTECLERAEALATAEGASKSLKVDTPFGKQTLRALKKSCQSQLKAAQHELERANAQKELDDFLKTCKGDEVEVVRRLGMPARVDDKDGGRVFVYETPGRRKRKPKRFAFNKEGKRVDEKTLRAAKGKEIELEEIIP
ncbi:hypothetical protein ACFL6C_09725 [Myxococcota bacterium]